MSGSENGANHTAGDRSMVSPERTIGARSASPAKRSAADMEDAGQRHVPASSQQEQSHKVPGSFTNEEESGPTDFDVAMQGMTPARQSLETQETGHSFATSDGGAMSVDTQAMSVQQDGESNGESNWKDSKAVQKEPFTTAQTDEQVRHVRELSAKALDEGDRGVVISNQWLSRVLSRTSENLTSGEFSKQAREGDVGPLDNSDIVPEGAFKPPHLLDPARADFIPLKPGLAVNGEVEVLPHEAYGYIVSLYGYKQGQGKPIIRYAHNTADRDATTTNIIYELHPPVITVRKVPQPADNAPKKPTAMGNLNAKRAQQGRGQVAFDDAIKLVSSRTEKFQNFLRRAKEAAGIPLTTKVKIWRLQDSTEVAVDSPENKRSGVLSPPASRDPSPSKSAAGSTPKLVIDPATFAKMEVGRDLEATDGKDETSNEKYNGSMNMETAGFFQDSTIVLEEQIGGPAGGEFQSDQKKGAKSFLKKPGGSKPGSAPASGRTSPAPGMMTRGRTRKDGRTKGTVGLTNLGNTCYMNSALQCIRSVEELALYFLSNKYKPEINNDNPLGHHGAMANAYAGVLKGIYDGGMGGAFTPRQFKNTLGNLQPLFSGYGQQDSQEFLSFLVDALHEDLNRVYKKPYTENPDSEDDKVRDPEYIYQLGQTYRENHAKRNDSVAMDLFSGFYKNTMECPNCDKVSVTFDPYSLLTVQLPMDHAFQHLITFVPLYGKPIMHQIDMDKNSSIKTLKEHIAKKHDTDANRLWMVEVYNNKIYKIFDDSTSLAEASIQSNDYNFIYELDEAPKNAPSPKKNYYSTFVSTNTKEDIPPEGMDSEKADVFAVPIFQRFVGRNDKHEVGQHPLYITVTREEAKNYEIIFKKILIAVQNITSRHILREFQDNSQRTGTVEEMDDESSKEQNGPEDAAGVSDHSAQSEDGYVNVSLEKPAMANGTSPMQIDDDEDPIPSGFMDPQYFLSPALRNQLFDVKYSEGADGGLHCISMSSVKDSTVRTMLDRVKSARRASLESSNSDESSTSAGNTEENESDADDLDKPDITLGEESTLSTPTVENSDEEDSGIMPPSEQEPNQLRSGRRKNRGKRRGKKARRGNQITYGKKDRNQYGQSRNGSGSALKSVPQQPENSPYYIQLGECIVLDWRPEAADSLLNGDPQNPDDMRGFTYVDENGRRGDIFHDEELEARRKKRDERKKHGLDLEDCFVETGKREVLSEDNAWYCNRCKELRRATKTLEIWTLPDILVVHLKRFGGNRSFRDKIDVLVDYPIEGLNMNDKVGLKEDGKDYTYDLFAVDNHYGGLGGGHYTAMAKNFYDGEWYDYNDSVTSKISNDNKLQSAAAYLLFYRRRSDKPLGPQYLQDIVNDFRNPSAEEDAADEESGEDRLGGPAHSSQHGSSSALAGAGVAAMSSQTGSGGNGGAGAAGRLLTQGSTTNSNEGAYGGAGNTGWGFGALDGADEDGDRLLNNMDDDADSNKAQFDHDNDSGFEDAMDFTTNHNSPSGGHSPPIFQIDVGDTSDMPALEGPEDKDPPAQDIHLSDVQESAVHVEDSAEERVKMD